MPLVVTPGSLSNSSELYHELGAMLGAGVPILQVLDHLQRAPPSRSFREPLRQTIQLVGQGATFTEALRVQRRWLPSFDLALLEAGEVSGRLEACCRLLADYYRERAQLARRVIADLGYPLFMVHALVFVTPTLQLLFLGIPWSVFLLQTVGVLAPLYALSFALIFACQGRHGEQWRAFLERVTHRVPLLGPARRRLALARLAAALEALISAGVPILKAWELAATACGSPALRREVMAWKPRLEAGDTPADLLARSRDFPEMFSNLYHTGEISGTLDDTLKRLHRLYQEDAMLKLKALAEWFPRLVYLGAALLIVSQIVSTWKSYVAEVGKILGP